MDPKKYLRSLFVRCVCVFERGSVLWVGTLGLQTLSNLLYTQAKALGHIGISDLSIISTWTPGQILQTRFKRALYSYVVRESSKVKWAFIHQRICWRLAPMGV